MDDPVTQKEPSFEELLAESEKKTVARVQTGQKLEARVVTVSKDLAYVDIGMRTEAVLPFVDGDERFESLKEGDGMEVYVIKPGGQVRVALDPILGYGDFSVLEKAFESGEAVEGKVATVIPGGYEVNIAGVRCFCPHSQMDMRPVGDSRALVNQTLPFKVIELEASSNNVVLSRRALLEEALRHKIEETRAKLVAGAVLEGRVADLQPFGAFVDLGGIQGLVHISELAHQNVARVEDVLQPGDEVKVKVLDVSQDSRGKDRISLSIKALLPDPWDHLRFQEGETLPGKVVRISKFGIFVNLTEAMDGLLPRRFLKKAGRSMELEDFEVGQDLEVEVVEIDRHRRKIALALPGWDDVVKSSLTVGETLQVEVIKVLPAGVLVQGVEDPAKGLIHKRTLKDFSGKQIIDKFPAKSQHEVVLDEIDGQGRFNFVLKTAAHEVDRETLARFSENKESLGHNPFEAFFKPDKSS